MKNLLLVILLVGFQLIKAQNKPNILVIYTDQQRYNTLRCLGNDEIITPNLDKLVETGTAFTHSFVSAPVCMPSRWSLHSGMYTSSHRAYSNHHAPKEKPKTSLPLELKNQGYKTALIGKNHSYLNEEVIDVMDHGEHFKKKPEDGRNALKAMPWKVEDDPMHKLTNHTLELLGETKEENAKPVFIWLSYLYPHTPYLCPEPYFSMYDTIEISKPAIEREGLKAAGKPFRQQFHQFNNNGLLEYDEETTMRMKRNYYGMVSMIDAEIGRLVTFLEDKGLRENTIIVFTSDHGDYMGDHGLYTKSPSMYDCLTRVPLIFNWPGKIKANKVSDELVSNVDIMPTLLDFVNIAIPDQVQGISLVNHLEGGKLKNTRNYVVSEYGIPGVPYALENVEELMPDYKENPIYFSNPKVPWEANPVALSGRMRMIRSHNYKLVQELNGTSELYDLKRDPNELINLYNNPKYKGIQKKMTKALENWKKDIPGTELDSLQMGEKNMQKYLQKRAKKK